MANGSVGSVGSLPGLKCSIDRRPGLSCLICHATDRSLLFREDDLSAGHPFGICEPCTLSAHWAWRQLSGEILPGFPEEDLRRVSTVFALVARRREVPRLDACPGDGEPAVRAPAELNSSWEFLLADRGDGTHSPPSISSDEQPDLRDLPRAALSALSRCGLSSWPALAEPLFTGYSPRGRLVAVALIRGWADLPSSGQSPLAWRSWPLSAHTGPMAGFWRALETVWPLRLHKHCVVEDSGELCVQLREAACRYIELQIALRSRKASDSSMVAIYRAAMSVDELAVDRLIQLAEERAVGGSRSLAVIPGDGGERSAAPVPGRGRRGSSIAPWDDPAAGDGQDETAEGEEGGDPGDGDGFEDESDDAGDDDVPQDGDGPPEADDPTFVRPRRPLKR